MTAVLLDLPGPSRRVVIEPLRLPVPGREPVREPAPPPAEPAREPVREEPAEPARA